MSTIAKEACLMFSHNQMLEWLQTKPDSELAKHLSKASKAIRKTRKCFKEAGSQGCSGGEHEEELTLKRLRKKEQQTADIVYWGLWQTEQQVDDAELSSKRRC